MGLGLKETPDFEKKEEEKPRKTETVRGPEAEAGRS